MISNISAFAQSREYGKGVIHMVQGKVEITGVNTAKLRVLKRRAGSDEDFISLSSCSGSAGERKQKVSVFQNRKIS